MEQQSEPFWGERFKAKLKATGVRLWEGLGQLMEEIERYRNELVPCRRCEALVRRKDLFTLASSGFADAPPGFEKPYRCCPLCVAAAREELARLLRNQAHVREYQRAADQCVRAREKGLPATLTGKQWVAILDSYNWRCA